MRFLLRSLSARESSATLQRLEFSGFRRGRRRATSPIRKGLALAVPLLLGACAASGLEGHVYRQGDVHFRVGPVPEDWRLLDDEMGRGDLAAFAFRDDAAGATIGAAGRCGRDGDDVPLESLTQHLYLGFTQREFHSVARQRLDGRAALRTEMSASLDGVRKHLIFVVLKKDGCVYDFWRIGERPPGADTDEFDRFVGGFQALQ